jgi:hypothetical protein
LNRVSLYGWCEEIAVNASFTQPHSDHVVWGTPLALGPLVHGYREKDGQV